MELHERIATSDRPHARRRGHDPFADMKNRVHLDLVSELGPQLFDLDESDDGRDRVLGCTGLRVIDASIMPEVPRANTHLTTVAIAESMADRLKGAA